MMDFVSELKRRNVIRMAGLYLVGAWLLVQVAGTVLPWFSVSASVLRGLVVVLAIGPFATAMAALGTKIPLPDIEAIFIGAYGSEAERKRALAALERHRGDEYVPTLLIMLGEPERSFEIFEHSQSGLSDAYFDWLWLQEDWSRKARQSPAFQGFSKRLGLVAYWQKNAWPDLCEPAPDIGPDAFTCK